MDICCPSTEFGGEVNEKIHEKGQLTVTMPCGELLHISKITLHEMLKTY